MKTKLVLSSEKKDFIQWTDLPFIPRVRDYFNVSDILRPDEIEDLKNHSISWSGEKGIVKTVEYRHDDDGFYIEIGIQCEDSEMFT
jgi:hypothetical protein